MEARYPLFHSGETARKERVMQSLLLEIYQKLYQAFGPQHWWPAETPFEVMVGAILTQNTSWGNVEKAIQSLEKKGALEMDMIRQIKKSALASLIRSSGTYQIKANRLKAFVDFVWQEYQGQIGHMEKESLETLRRKLLEVHGIGPETADTMLLYGLGKPIFVVDAYTKRIFSRHGVISDGASYDETQALFMDYLPHETARFNEYHALLVHLGKTLCKKIPKCAICPLNSLVRQSRNPKVPKVPKMPKVC